MDNNKKQDVTVSSEEITEADEPVIASEAKQSQDDVEQELEQLKALSQQLENNYKRALADYQNLQRRTQEEKVEWIRMAGKDVVLKFLPILDTLILAEKHTKDQNFVLTVQQFLKVLEDEGVTRIKTIGEKFNPESMEAVSTAEGKKDTVMEEMRAGFMYYDMVLRAAQVVVGA